MAANKIRFFIVFLLLGLGHAGTKAGTVADPSGASKTHQQVNSMMAERAELLIEAHKMEQEIRQAWANSRYTSPELEKLRARYRELQHELAMTQIKLQQQAEATPELQAKKRQFESIQKRVRELENELNMKPAKPQP